MLGSNTLALNPSLRKNMPYDTMKDLTPVALIARQPFVLVVRPDLPVKTLQELLDLAKKKPGELNYASSGIGTGNHLVTEQFLKMSGVKIQHVPYQGTGRVFNDLLGGRVDMIITTALSLFPYIESGQLRPLGVGDLKRLPQLPDVPTISEAGVPGFNETSWGGILVTGGTPPEIVAKLNAALAKVMVDPEVVNALSKAGAEATISTPEEFRDYIKSEIAKWAEVIKFTGLKAQ
jgi:tripartite-type tricarboxylate transporter receptor subunit TctC